MLINKNLSKEQIIVKIVRWLILLKGAGLLVFAVGHLLRFQSWWSLILAVLFFFDAVVFLWLNRVIEKKNKHIFYFAVIFIGINIFLIVIDELGLIDFLILFLDCILFVMILGNKKKLLVN